MVLKSGKTKFAPHELAKNSLCEFIRETRFAAPALSTTSSAVAFEPQQCVRPEDAHLEDQSKSSECSDGFTLMEFPDV